FLSAALNEQAAEENEVNRDDGKCDAKMRAAPGFLFQERTLRDERVWIIHGVGRWRWRRGFDCFEAMVHGLSRRRFPQKNAGSVHFSKNVCSARSTGRVSRPPALGLPPGTPRWADCSSCSTAWRNTSPRC